MTPRRIIARLRRAAAARALAKADEFFQRNVALAGTRQIFLTGHRRQVEAINRRYGI